MTVTEPTDIITTPECLTYVSLCVARLAAQKGYDTFCNATWTHYLKEVEEYQEEQISFTDNGFLKGRNSHYKKLNNSFYYVYAAPTQEALKAWLRSEHNIEVEVNFNPRFNFYDWMVFKTTGRNKRNTSRMCNDNQKRYVIAFEHALKIGLDYLKDKK